MRYSPPNSVGMRFFNVWAEEGSRDDMLYEMLKQGTAKYITRHKRDWVHVMDVVRAVATLIPSSFTGTIDVGTGQMTSVIDLANAWVWVIFLSRRTHLTNLMSCVLISTSHGTRLVSNCEHFRYGHCENGQCVIH